MQKSIVLSENNRIISKMARVFRFLNSLTFFLLFPFLLFTVEKNSPLPTLSELEVVYFNKFVEGNNRFAFDLYQKIRLQSGNIHFSSYSIASGLGMLMVGTTGVVQREFQNALGYTSPLLLFNRDLNQWLQKKGDSSLQGYMRLENSLWVDKSIPILPSFNQLLLRNFGITFQVIDFTQGVGQATDQINHWVNEKTEKKIRNIILTKDLSTTMQLILTTAADISGRWLYPFDRSLTKRIAFQLNTNRTSLAHMMTIFGNFLVGKSDQVELLLIPLLSLENEAQIQMAIILPKKGITLSEVENHFNWKNWEEWKKKLKKQPVKLSLPRFRIDRRVNLASILQGLGMTAMFIPSSDFSPMTNQLKLSLNQVVHKMTLLIDERGLNLSGLLRETPQSLKKENVPYEFIADRPFLFLFFDQRTNSILSLGRLSTPY